jgi:hypothetical protein
MFTVYALEDSRDDTVHYVGVTNDLQVRLSQHMRYDGSNQGRDTWIQEVLACGGEIRPLIVEEVDEQQVNPRIRETYWIHHYLDLNAPLTNENIPPRKKSASSHRDAGAYVYLTIGILRGSPAHLSLLADAEEHGVKQLPTLASIRLGDYYEMKRQGVTVAPVQDGSKVTPPLADIAENIDAANDAWPE